MLFIRLCLVSIRSKWSSNQHWIYQLTVDHWLRAHRYWRPTETNLSRTVPDHNLISSVHRAFHYITIIIVNSRWLHGFPWHTHTLSLYSSLSFIAPGSSSRLHPASAQSWRKQVLADWPIPSRSCLGVYRRISLLSWPLLLQQCPVCLVRLNWMVFEIGG